MQTGQSLEIKSGTDLLSLTCKNTYIHEHTYSQTNKGRGIQTDRQDVKNRSLTHLLARTDGIVSFYLTCALFKMLKV